MKKLVLAMVAVAAISFASCNGNKTAQNTASADSDTALVQDSDSVQAQNSDSTTTANDSVK